MGRISRLSEEVVNRIAAGEVVVRPANAVKELLENSLDAGSTEIIVTARNGGLDLIQIQDNGKGIEKEDMSVVCERFTTSKLEKMEDLENISTFGFRGEALASITHVAKVSITSKTTDSSCAYLAHYKDGVLVGDIRPSAGLDGTIITVENLFYNCPARRHALKYPADELNRIADVIVRYAIHNPQISFIFRRCGSGSDFRTNGDGSLRSAVQMLLGSKAASDLIMLDFTNDSLYFSLSGCVARPSASCTALTLQSRQNRQKVFYLFINNRSVECPALKQRLDIVFASKDTLSQFVMLSLKIPANRVDVNVHPTKSVVFFLEQDAIIASVEEYIAKLISDATQSDVNKAVSLGDTFQPPVIIEHLARSDGQFSRKNSQPGAVASVKRRNSVADINISVMDRRQEYAENSSSTTVSRKPQARKLVRTDARERRLEEFAVQGSSQNLSQVETIIVNPSIDNDSDSVPNLDDAPVNCREFDFISLRSMRKAICAEASKELRQMFKNHTYIGAVDVARALIQTGTSIYLIDVEQCLRSFFYQLFVLSFGNFGAFKLAEPCCLTSLFRLHKLTDEKIQEYVETLVNNRLMLEDYFSLRISENGILEAIPSLIADYIPQMEGLPDLVLDLVQDVSWDEERSCFEGISTCLASFFCLKERFCDGEMSSALGECSQPWKHVMSDILFPSMKNNFLPPTSFLSKKVFCRLVDLHDLYKVFERC